MLERARIGDEPLTLSHEEPVGDPPHRTFGMIFAAVVALVASAGLAWWIASPTQPADVVAPPAQPPPPAAPAHQTKPEPLRYAPAEPDPAQVRQALVDVQQAYADGGAEGLVQASAACARQLPLDPRRLDYCLAYDVYAAQIVPPGSGPAAADWFKEARDRDAALAAAALPAGVDAANRMAQVGELTRAVLPGEPAKAKPPALRVAKAAPAKPVKAAAKVKSVKAKAASRKASARSKVVRATSEEPWSPPGPSTLDEQYAREAAAEAELDRQISQGMLDPPH
jgi:hypothetical protein